MRERASVCMHRALWPQNSPRAFHMYDTAFKDAATDPFDAQHSLPIRYIVAICTGTMCELKRNYTLHSGMNITTLDASVKTWKIYLN